MVCVVHVKPVGYSIKPLLKPWLVDEPIELGPKSKLRTEPGINPRLVELVAGLIILVLKLELNNESSGNLLTIRLANILKEHRSLMTRDCPGF